MPHVFVILMRRWGDTEKHSYLGGVYPEFFEAQEAAEEEATSRGGKYEYQIFRCQYRTITKVADTCKGGRGKGEHICNFSLDMGGKCFVCGKEA